MTKYEYPKESVKNRIIHRLNYLSKWIENYNKNPPIYLATPNMLKRFERMFTETTLKLHGLTQDPNKKWIGRYHGEILNEPPIMIFELKVKTLFNTGSNSTCRSTHKRIKLNTKRIIWVW